MSDPEMKEWIYWEKDGKEGIIPDHRKVSFPD